MAERKSAMSARQNVDEMSVTIEFADGRELTVACANLNPECARIAPLHGLEQKLRDAGALGMVTEPNGRVRPATVDEKFAAVQEVAQRLNAGGPWNAPGRAETGGLLYAAMVRALKTDEFCPNPASFADWLAEQAAAHDVTVAEFKKSLQADSDIQAAANEIRIERDMARGVRTSPKIDTKSILAGLKK